MYNNQYIRPFNNSINQQNMYEQIDNQINQLQQMREQIKNSNTQPAINQTFQLAPTGTNTLRYANTIDDVVKEIVYGDTPFFSKDMSIVWVKSVKGEVKTYELNEIVPKDEKDIKIDFLMAQIEELKKGITNERDTNANEYVTDADESEKSSAVSTISKPNKKQKQSE